ncbi:MAG: hypothetical protein M5R38_17295 [Candidatus Methylomirabilis sp.]|nr:hypothetical protein [Candidatus Methylomirabilis sp.]
MTKKRVDEARMLSKDEEYFQLIAKAIQVCATYKPKFGKGKKAGLTLGQFQQMYRADPFYNWVGLDSPLMYAAHKGAGGMTSIYRQLGIGCQWLFHQLLQDQLGLSSEQASWQYQVPVPGKQPRTLSLDGRITLGDIATVGAKARVEQWLQATYEKVLLTSELRPQIRGAVFEVRQGYKSKDSKRQNADISNASNAYANLYIPVLLLLSTQIDNDVAIRYSQARWLLLTGTVGDSSTESPTHSVAMCWGYDLAGFFEKNSARFRKELERVLTVLLRAK